jgi:hypothetical protein
MKNKHEQSITQNKKEPFDLKIRELSMTTTY